MSEHAWVQENLEAYVIGAMAPSECSRVERHLKNCSECVHLKAEISEMEQLMEGICTPTRPDAGLEDRAISKLRQVAKPRPQWLRFVMAAAAVVMLGGVGSIVRMFALDGTLPLPGMEQQVAKAAKDKNRVVFNDAFENEKRRIDEEVKQQKREGFDQVLGDEMDKIKDALNKTVTEVTADKNITLKVQTHDDAKRDAGRNYSFQVLPGFFPDDKGKEKVELDRFYERATKDVKELGDQHKQDQIALLAKMKMLDKEAAKDLQAEIARDKATSKTAEAKALLGTTNSGGSSGVTGIFSPPGVPAVTVPPGSAYSGGGVGPPGAVPPVPVTPITMAPPTGLPPPSTPYLPMPPPPVVVAKDESAKGDPKTGNEPGDSKAGQGDKQAGQKPGDDGGKPLAEQPAQPKPQPKVEPKEPEKTGRMIIRTGEMEFETDSFDNSFKTILKLAKAKGGFVATVNSDKLANGKTKGSIVVRMPPTVLDEFILELRDALGKSSELKNQRLGSLDITKQYTDIASRLRAARAIEDRLIAIIKTGKGEIKDLVAAEKELGVWRTKIEEMEGEIRYYANQVSLATLTIQLAEKEIQAPTAIVVTETVSLRIETDDVAKAHQTAMKAVEDFKGRITRSELKQHSAGQLLSVLHAEIPPGKKDAFLDVLKKLGIVSDHQENQRQHTEGGSGRAPELKPKQSDILFQVTINNTANIRPRLSADLKIATTDVPGAYAKLLDKIAKVKGQVRDGKLNEQDKLNIHAHIDFNVPTAEKPAIDKMLEEIGPVLERVNIQCPVSELSTTSKFGYTVLLRDFASIPPRQALVQHIATIDVPAAYAKIQDAIAKAKGQVADAKLNEQDKLNVTAQLEFTVPSEQKDAIEKVLTDLGTVLSRNNVQTPANQLATVKKFGFSLLLRDFASIPPSKASDLKVATNDVPASYAKLLEAVAKLKGQLVNAQLNENDKFNITAQVDFSIPTDAKPEIDKLLDQIGTILSRNNVQAPMNQLTINKKFGYAITLRDFANIMPSHASDIKLATNDVPNNYARLVEAVVKAKGQISTAKLNEQDKLNVAAFLNFTVPTSEKQGIDKLLAQMGTILSRNNVQAPAHDLTTEKKFGYAIALRDFANIPPRETFHIQVAAVDVASSFRKLQDAVAAAKGMVTVGQLTEDNKVKMEAHFEFDVPAAERQAIEKLFTEVGAVMGRTSSQVPVNELATDQKVGYKLTVRSTAAIPPRETVQIKMEVKDVDGRATDLKDLIVAGKGRIIDSNIDRHENGQVLGELKFEVPFASQDSLLRQIKAQGTVVSQQAKRNPNVPENELTTSHIIVTLAGVTPIVPSDEGLGSYIRTSLYMSFKVFSVCLMLIILGVSAILPWAIVIWVGYKAYARFVGFRGAVTAPASVRTTPPPAAPPAQA